MSLQKILLILAVITLPVFTFILGMSYQKGIYDKNQVTITPTPTPYGVACTEDAKICPDGSTVGRIQPNCEFAPCPDESVSEQAFCGGIAGIECNEGYTCQLDGDYPDAGGTCTKIENSTKYECPAGNYVNCMPGPVKSKKTDCNPSYIRWAEANCPGFEVVY